MAGTNSRCLFQGRAGGGFRPSDKLKRVGGGGGEFGPEKNFFPPFRPQFVLNIRGGITSPGSTTEGPLQGLCHGRLIHFFKYCQLGVLVGESLYTLFASLTYAYHYLMTLIK